MEGVCVCVLHSVFRSSRWTKKQFFSSFDVAFVLECVFFEEQSVFSSEQSCLEIAKTHCITFPIILINFHLSLHNFKEISDMRTVNEVNTEPPNLFFFQAIKAGKCVCLL